MYESGKGLCWQWSRGREGEMRMDMIKRHCRHVGNYKRINKNIFKNKKCLLDHQGKEGSWNSTRGIDRTVGVKCRAQGRRRLEMSYKPSVPVAPVLLIEHSTNSAEGRTAFI